MSRRQLFHYPEVGAVGYGRVLSAVEVGGALWGAAQKEEGGRTGIEVVRSEGEALVRATLFSDGYVHQPSLFEADDAPRVAWNEWADPGWRVRVGTPDPEAGELRDAATLRKSDRLCLPPRAVAFDGETWVAWAERFEGRIALRVARGNGDAWAVAEGPAIGGDAFRPWLAAGDAGLFMAWDAYGDGGYEVGVAKWDGAGWRTLDTLGEFGERWMTPKVAVTPGGVYLTWVALREVSDDLGIADHWPLGMLARVTDDGAEIVTDPNHPDDDRIAADLRGGLLAVGRYNGYHGLRRNPQLSVDGDGRTWLLWESGLETGGAHQGLLAGRPVEAGGLGSPRILHRDGYSYAAPETFRGEALPVAYYHDAGGPPKGIQAARLDPAGVEPFATEAGHWRRWRVERVPASPRPTRGVTVDGEELDVFWSDTHCHSIYSPDAEGEVDELIQYARDEAGLDAVCILDNDYYPNKAHTEAEWRAHQEFCRHFTREGEFVVFPGYEFTFHRDDLTPDFNHRTVIYARPGGRIVRRHDADGHTDVKLLETLRDSGAMLWPHHWPYKLLDTSVERNVEILSSWLVAMEETPFTMDQLRAGERFGFVGASDTHRACPGLGGAMTGVYADALTPEALFGAWRDRRTVATQGFRILVDFRVSGVFIGGEGVCEGAPVVEATVEANDPVAFVEVVRDGDAVHRVEPGGKACEFRFEDADAGEGDRFYFLRVRLEGDPSFNMTPEGDWRRVFSSQGRYPHNFARARGVFAWTSPVWIERR